MGAEKLRSCLLLCLLAACDARISAGRLQELFRTPFRPEESRHFQIAESSTFEPDADKRFDLSYADGSELKGFNGKDVVHVGDFHGMAPFGLIYDCNSPDFNGVDGILGFGLPKQGIEGMRLPTPLLWVLTDRHDTYSNTQDLARKFAFFSTDDAAEVQLGGYDPKAISSEMYYTPSLSSTDFIVGVTSVKFGRSRDDSQELLQFSDPTGAEYLPAIVDSGTSCLVIPGDTLDGRLSNRPFHDFTSLWARDKSFFIEIGGKEFEVPFSSWYLARTNQTCVQPSPAGMQGLLIGDVFFRSYLVEFDMKTEDRPMLGMAKLSSSFVPVLKSDFDFYQLPQTPFRRLSLLKGEETMYPQAHTQRLEEVDRVQIFNKKGTQYFMDLSIGTPPQPFTVIFDTGSAVFGVFTYESKLPETIASELKATQPYHVTIGAVASLMAWEQDPGSPFSQQDEILRVQKAKHQVLKGKGETRLREGQAITMAMAAVELSPHMTGAQGLTGMAQRGAKEWGLGAASGWLMGASVLAAFAVAVRRRDRRSSDRGLAVLAPSTSAGYQPIEVSSAD